MPERLDRLIADLPFLAPLRPDELCRAARRFRSVELSSGEVLPLPAPAVILVTEGCALVETSPLPGEAPPVRTRLEQGDHLGSVSVFSGMMRESLIRAERPARLALLDRAGYDLLLDEFPIVAVPSCALLVDELTWMDDLLREVTAIETDLEDPGERAAALEARRARATARIARRGRARRRRIRIGAFLSRALEEPAFFMLMGLLGAFSSARLLVAYILSHHKEKTLFALHHVAGFDNPIHIHHFNYGLGLVTLTSLLAFLPAFRKHLSTLAFVFGVGSGLILDEFALIWNLDPDYYQGLSRVAVAAGVLVLFQLAFFRGFLRRAFRRLTRWGAA